MNMNLPPEEREILRAQFSKIDHVAMHREAADRIAREGDFPEVIRLLSRDMEPQRNAGGVWAKIRRVIRLLSGDIERQ